MPTPASDLHDRLERLAGQAPQQLEAVDLWSRGRARARRRTWQQGGFALACLLLLGFVGGSALLLDGPPPSPPAATEGEVALPDELFVPNPWATTRTLEDGPPGRLVAVVGAERRTITSAEMGFYGVSATTGEYTWLDLPDLDEAAPVSLSPDGTRVAWWLQRPDPYDGVHEVVDGYAILDTVTGEVSRHEVPSELGLSAEGMAWTPGTAWFWFSAVTEMDSSSSTATLQPTHLVDLDSGEVTRLSVTSSPGVSEGQSSGGGFVVHDRGPWHRWVAGTRPAAWERFQGIRGVQDEVVPSADGTLLAGIEAPESTDCCAAGAVRVGVRSGSTVRWRTVPGDDYDQVLGWRSPTQVLATSKGRVFGVDVESGEAEPITRMTGTNFLQQPVLATALLDAPVVPAVDRPTAVDQRVLLVGGTVLVVLGALASWSFLVWRRRARA